MTARVLVDQCVSRRMVEPALRPLADVAFISDIALGASDIDVLELARMQQRILITEDYDFGALIFGDRRAPPIGVIHLALAGMDKNDRDQKFAAEVAHLLDIAPGHFVVFSKNAARSRPLP